MPALAAGRRQPEQIALCEGIDAGRVVEKDDQPVRVGDPTGLADQLLEPLVPELSLPAGAQRRHIDQPGEHCVQLLRGVRCPRHQLRVLRGQVPEQPHHPGQPRIERVDPQPERLGRRDQPQRHTLQKLPAPTRCDRRSPASRSCATAARRPAYRLPADRSARTTGCRRRPAAATASGRRSAGSRRARARGGPRAAVPRARPSASASAVAASTRPRDSRRATRLLLQLPMQLHRALVLALGEPARVLEEFPERELQSPDPCLQNLRCEC